MSRNLLSYVLFDLFQSLNLCRDNSISFVQNKATSPLFRTQLLFMGWKTSPQVVLEQSPNYDRMNYNQITIKAEYEHLLFPTILFLKFYYILLGRLSKWHTSNMSQGPNWISFSFFCLRLDEKWLLVIKSPFISLDQNQMWWPYRLWEPKSLCFDQKSGGPGTKAPIASTYIASQCVLKSNKCEVYVPSHSCQ